ncbi:transcriptional regulator family: Fungal Specific TF [Paecilomyces variotii]|nr:transcriptional regulator family: Fungal Specific TF [Paecilomyces variotii]
MSFSLSVNLDNASIRPLRSRLGCKTCKIRRVKCGEEKPNCLRCTSTGRKCEYENTIARTYWSSASTISILDTPLSLLSNAVLRERRAFAYYFQNTATFVGGGLDVDFWLTIVPQVCRSEPAVWDALISISSLFESPDPCPDLVSVRRGHARTLNQNQQDALVWYSRSVSAVRRGIERGSVDSFVGLITCILFICIEALWGGMEEALHLYSQGVHLILALQTQSAYAAMTETKTSLLKDTIVPIFIRIGAVTLNTGVSMSPLLQETEHESAPEFTSLKSAREAIVILAIEIPLFELDCEEYLIQSHACHISEELMSRQKVLSSRLQSWYTAFTNMMESLRTKDGLSALQASTGALLLTYYEMLSVIIGVCVSPLRITTDAYTSNFQNIAEQSRIALTGSARRDGTQPPFTFELSVGLPLWFTCIRCREPTIRRTALALLRRAHHIEGLYKRDYAATMSERIIMVEEMYGITSSAAQSVANITTRKPNDACIEHKPRCQGSRGPHSPFDMDFELGASPYLPLTDTEPSTSEAVLIPAEARIRPLGIFRPRDGYPPEMTEEDIARLSLSRDQTFLHFSRNEHDQYHKTWHTIHGYVPIEF